MKTIRVLTLFLLLLSLSFSANAVTVQKLDSFLAKGDLCLSPNLSRYIWVRGKDVDWQNKPLSERYKTVLDLYSQQSQAGSFKTLFNGPWDRALTPVFEAQRDSIFDALLTVDTSGSLFKGVTYDHSGEILSLDALEAYLKSGSNIQLPNMIDTLAKAFGAKRKKLDEFLNSTPERGYSSWAKNTVAISAACSQISMLQTPSCVSAVNAVLTEANFNANMILPKIWLEFIQNAQLRDGVRNSALVILGRLKNHQQGRLFEDINHGFRLAGLKPIEANEATWKLLALFGNGGPNTGYRLLALDLPPEATNLTVSLSFISTAISYLDYQQKMAGENHYAFPVEATGSCLSPKSYHFWLSAYFARWLVKQGYSPEVAEMATFIVNKGYQVNRDLNNAGGGIDKILSKSTDHPTNEVIRVDLNLAAAGAVYGSRIEKQGVKPFSLAGGLQFLEQSRGESARLSQRSLLDVMLSDRIRLLKVWDQLFNPNAALHFFQTQQN